MSFFTDLINNLGLGFSVALQWENLLYAFLGGLIGTLIGVLPGLGPVATIAMLLPITYKLDPTAGLIMLAGIYYGAQYGGSTTAILVNLPGESSSVVTAIDGYQMARNGRAGQALSTAAIGSFMAGCFATLVLAAFAPTLSEMAIKLGAQDYVSLMILGLIGSVVLANGSVVKAIGMIFIGFLIAMVGQDAFKGGFRFTFDILDLSDGIDFAIVAMGFFGFAEVIANLEDRAKRDVFMAKIKGIYPTLQDWKDMLPAIGRGTVLGSMLGVLPGGGATIASFAAYAIEKKVSKHPEQFGHGAIQGVAGPESANNAASQTSFIPLLTLGIPSNAVMALMIGAMMIHDITPGPGVVSSNPDLFWGLIASMWVGNLVLIILNLPLIGIWVSLLKIPYKFLFSGIIVVCCIGLYTLNNSTFHVYLAAFFGLLGYIFGKLRCEGAPMLLGIVLGAQLEDNFARAVQYETGERNPLLIFITSPISATLLLLALALLVIVCLPSINKKREEAFVEE